MNNKGFAFSGIASAGNKDIIYNGIPWFDDRGNIVNAHGACIVEDNGKFYLFGEWKSDESNIVETRNAVLRLNEPFSYNSISSVAYTRTLTLSKK